MSPSRIRIAVALLLIAGGFIGAQSFRWKDEKGAQRAHEKFLARVADRRWSKVRSMISVEYSDRWGFDREKVTRALQDVGGQFFIDLQIDWQTDSIVAGDEIFTITGRMEIDGRGGPAAELILRQGRVYLSETFIFHWRREGLLPWKWKLLKMEHPTIEVPAGYQPGDMSSMAAPF